MEYTSVSPVQTSRAKTVSLIALAIVGTMVASYAMLNVSHTHLVQVSTSTNSGSDCINEWNAWKAKHNKTFNAAENDKRFAIFCKNHDTINNHNNNSNNTFQLGHNHFSHLTQEEFAATSLGLKKPNGKDGNATHQNYTHDSRILASLPTSVNWTAKGAVTPIKNQGQCGSCYTFSSTGALEGLAFIKTKKLPTLSEQQLVDCSSTGNYGNGGCNGGWMGTCFQYVADNKGIGSETTYPYQGTQGTCKTGVASSYSGEVGYTQITANSKNALLTAINQQPTSVCVEADQNVFQLYKSGIISGSACGTNTDHAVLAVGYNTAASTPYYIIKNSWGASWGEIGYFRLAITGDGSGTCGVQEWGVYPH